jgi:hypothetical protein
LEQILRDAHGEILPIPHVAHEHLIKKAIARHPPFDEKGSGYRDALVWGSVLDVLEGSREPVMFVSADRIFSRDDGSGLAIELVAELHDRGFRGRAKLYPDLKAVVAEIPRVRELASHWRVRMREDNELRQRLVEQLLTTAYEDASAVLGPRMSYGEIRDLRFVNFHKPRNLQIHYVWISQSGSAHLDVELTADYTIEFETMQTTSPP